MPSIYNLKPAFQNFLRPFSNRLWKWGVTPNQVTISAVVLSLIVGILITCYPLAHMPMLLVPLVLLLRMILNAIDGMLAREHHMQSKLGVFLNELGDVFSDTVIFLPFSLIPGISSSLIIGIVILSIISEMSGVVALQVGVKRRYDGPMGKSDRAFIFGLLGLMIGFGFKVGFLINLILASMVILLFITIVNRVKNALKARA